MSLLSLLFSRPKCWFAFFGCCIFLYYQSRSKPPGAGGLLGAVSNCSEAREHFNNVSSKIPCCVSGQEKKRKQEGLWLCCDCQLEVNNNVLCLRRCLLCTGRGERSVCLNPREVYSLKSRHIVDPKNVSSQPDNRLGGVFDYILLWLGKLGW